MGLLEKIDHVKAGDFHGWPEFLSVQVWKDCAIKTGENEFSVPPSYTIGNFKFDNVRRRDLLAFELIEAIIGNNPQPFERYAKILRYYASKESQVSKKGDTFFTLPAVGETNIRRSEVLECAYCNGGINTPVQTGAVVEHLAKKGITADDKTVREDLKFWEIAISRKQFIKRKTKPKKPKRVIYSCKMMKKDVDEYFKSRRGISKKAKKGI
jgi:hypothetical protein